MSLPPGPLVAWYGDDFTGSAAVLEVLAFAGVPSVLYFDVPTEAQAARFADARAIGIAGEARSKPPEWMAAHLPPVFAALIATGAPIVHYKVCSTFDSAPHVGSIGKAADVALGLGGWRPRWVPLVVAAPAVGRWQAFGNLFAAAGEGVHRLDRHPTMAHHPVTPMAEADVARHLSAQTARRVGVLDLRDLAGDPDAALEGLTETAQIIAIDVMDAATLRTAGRLVWERAERMFAIGSQGLEYALVAHWQAAGLLDAGETPKPARAVDRVAVVSGSCSPITAAQIAHAEADGFAGVAIDPCAAHDGDAWEREEGRAVEAALAALSDGRDPLIHSARGPDDPRIAAFRDAGADAEANRRLGEGLGRALDTIVRRTGVRRAAIAGGDTSSAAAKGLGLYAVTAAAPLAPGAALLTGHSDEASTDGLEIALKGGQMGPPDFFTRLRAGGAGR